MFGFWRTGVLKKNAPPVNGDAFKKMDYALGRLASARIASIAGVHLDGFACFDEERYLND